MDLRRRTAFLATKRQADTALAASGIAFVILRPAVVVGRNAHGGSALLRALAAFPLITPLVHGESRMQFVALDDVAQTVLDAIEGAIPSGSDIDLAARRYGDARRGRRQPPPLARSSTGSRRQSAGLRCQCRFMRRPTSSGISAGVRRCDPRLWSRPQVASPVTTRQRNVRLATLDETLAANPAGVQDLWFARLYLLKPVIYATLCLFWILSGLIALARFDVSAGLLTAAGVAPKTAAILTVATSLLDIGLGVAVAVRRVAAPTLKIMIAVSMAYLAAATVLTPALWADPLGPLVKVLPSIALALAALAIYEER